MKNYAILALIFASFSFGSCVRTTPASLDYGIDSVAAMYINFDDTTVVTNRVRFLAGNDKEVVKMTVTGLPNRVRLAEDTVSGVPTFTAALRFGADSAVIGNYPVNIITWSKSGGYKSFPTVLGVVRNSCSSFLVGNLTGSSTCRINNYTYLVTSTANSGSSLNLVNFGGYGTNTNTVVVLDCNTNSLTIKPQVIGNGVTLSGGGSFTDGRMEIRFVAQNIPGGGNDSCTAILTR